MDYQKALQWVHSLPRLAGGADLARMEKLLAALQNPHSRLRYVHIAGTNGKGSAAALLASVLEKAGYCTGRNISPYVLDFRERFQINGEMIAEEELAQLLAEVKKAAETLPGPIVEFEAVTAAAFLYFARHSCDIVCLEVGLGGRLDATNSIPPPEVACILRIGFDHTELLGNTLAAIAAEKCGIIKPGCDVVSYPAQEPEAAAVIRRAAAAQGCLLHIPQMADIHIHTGAPFENRITYGCYPLRLPLPGPHQALNAAVVVEAALALRRRGYHIGDGAVINGIESARFPARIEVLRKSPPLILDGAHNADSALALAEALKRENLHGLSAVVGMLQDKDAAALLAALAPFVGTLYTVAPPSPRALPAQELAKLAGPYYKKVVPCKTLPDALMLAGQTPQSGILVCGSLYLASEARPLLLQMAAAPTL